VIVTLVPGADVEGVRGGLAGLGLWISSVERSLSGDVHLVIGGGSAAVSSENVERLSGVAGVSVASSAHPRVDAHGPVFRVGDLEVDATRPVVIAGPCAVESKEHIAHIASELAASGVRVLRGGAFKPRTSPYAFQGHGAPALEWMRRAADDNGMKVVTEVLSEHDVALVAEYADVLQVGSRSMQSFALLCAVGAARKPVLLKRSMSATVEEWLLAGEYLLSNGSTSLCFCERGLRHFDESTRNLLDLGAVALLSHVRRLPVIVDPSHAVGRRDLVLPLARAALAAGAAGVMLETHDDPAAAKSDGPQAIQPAATRALVELCEGERA
jgi:3-deoxy-7-phosphoheptulonate synthase